MKLSRPNYIANLVEKYAKRTDSILEIGCGDGRNIKELEKRGYTNIRGIDKLDGESIEDTELPEFDIIFTASCLFLIPEENEWVFEKIENLCNKYLITVEGETTKGKVIGRDYSKIFKNQVFHAENVFNMYGHARVFKCN